MKTLCRVGFPIHIDSIFSCLRSPENENLFSYSYFFAFSRNPAELSWRASGNKQRNYYCGSSSSSSSRKRSRLRFDDASPIKQKNYYCGQQQQKWQQQQEKEQIKRATQNKIWWQHKKKYPSILLFGFWYYNSCYSG